MKLQPWSDRQVGIDLGVGSIKVCLAENGAAVLMATFEDKAGPDPYLLENEALTEWLTLFVNEHGLKGTETVVGMSAERFVFVPATAKESVTALEIKARLGSDDGLAGTIPFSDAVIDCQLAVPTEETEADQHVWVGVTSRKMLRARGMAVADSGLNPVVIEPGLSGVARVLEGSPGVGRIVIDIGESCTQIGFVWRNRLVFLRAINIGVVSMVQAIADELQCNRQHAYESVRQHAQGAKYDSSIEQIIEPLERRIWGEVQRSVRLFWSRSALPPQREVCLLGGGALLVRNDNLEREVGCSVIAARLREDVLREPRILGEHPGHDEGAALGFAEAIGLSLREAEAPTFMSFHTFGDRRAHKELTRLSVRNPLCVVAGILVFTLLIHLYFRTQVANRREQVHRRQEEVQALSGQDRKVERYRSLKALWTQRADLLEKVRTRSSLFPTALLAVGQSVGPGVQITRIDILTPVSGKDAEGGQGALVPEVLTPRLSVQGSAGHPDRIVSFLERLQKSESLGKATVSVGESDSKNTIPFKIVAPLTGAAKESNA